MNDITRDLLLDAQLIINNHHEGAGENVMMEGYDIKQRAMVMAGFLGITHTEDDWDEYIPKLPEEIRGVMIDLDDSLDVHDTRRFM